MSIKATNWVYHHVKVGRHMKATLLALADNADDEGFAYSKTSMQWVATKVEVDRRTVIRHIKRLVELGVIEVQKRIGSSNVYRLRIEQSFDFRTEIEAPVTGDKMSLAGSDNLSPVQSVTSDKMSPATSDSLSPVLPPTSDTHVTGGVTPVSPLFSSSSNSNNTTTTAADPFKPSTVRPITRFPMTEDWQPDDQVFERLLHQRIDTSFAKDQIDGFRIYWQGQGVQHQGGWDSRFLSHVKHRWRAGGRDRHLAQQSAGQNIETKLTDRSWAEA